MKKTVPIYEDRLDMEKGIIYVGEGGLGVKLRTPDQNLWYLRSPGYAESLHNYYQLEISQNLVRVIVVKMDNTSFDTFELHPRVRPL